MKTANTKTVCLTHYATEIHKDLERKNISFKVFQTPTRFLPLCKFTFELKEKSDVTEHPESDPN